MVQSSGILVAHDCEEDRDRIGAALHEAGFEVIPVTTGREALRTTVGLNPQMVIAQAGLAEVSGYELPSRLQATGLALPPILILYNSQDELPEAMPEGAVYCVFVEGLSLDDLVEYVRLVMLAKQVQGEFGGNLEVVHGDLTRTTFGDLMASLQRNVISGRLDFNRSPSAGLWLDDGAVVEAWWGEVCGLKAFNRLAGLPSGGFSLRLAPFRGERSIDGFVGDLVVEAVEERLGFDDVMADLPSLEAKPEVQVVQDLFALEFSPVERQILSGAQKTDTLGELIDAVPATDLEVAKAVSALHERGLLVFTEPAGRVHLCTDSTCDLVGSEARRFGIEVVAASIVFGSEVYKDGVDLTTEGYYKKLNAEASLPTTAPPTKGEFVQVFRRMAATGDILGIYCSSKLSRSYQNAVAAAKEAEDDLIQIRLDAGSTVKPGVHAIDSGQCSGPLGMMAVLASRMLRRGLPLSEVVTRVEDLKTRFRTLLAVKSLEYLKRTGEVKEGAGTVNRDEGPGRYILAIIDGELKVADRMPPGPRTRSRLTELLGKGLDLERPVFASLVHASAPAEASAMRPLIHDRFKVIELMEEQIGPAVTCHTGPGTLGVSIFQPTEDELDILQLAEQL